MTSPQRIGQIICDASYEPTLFVAGFAGACVIETPEATIPGSGLHALYQGAKAEVLNSNVAELIAIEAGIREITDLAKRSALTLTDIVVHTDSKTAMKNIDNYLKQGSCDPRYLAQVERVVHAINKVVTPSHFAMEKVQAHVREDRANMMESFHNLMDKNANAARWIMTNHMFLPSTQQSSNVNYLGVLAPVIVSEQERDTFYRLGQACASQADKVRLMFNEPAQSMEDHPLIQGMIAGCEAKGITLMNLLADFQNGGSLTALPVCSGADRTLVRHHLYQSNVNTLTARVSHLKTQHNHHLAGIDFAKDALKAVPNAQVRIPLDIAESLYHELKRATGISVNNRKWVDKGLELCAMLRRQDNHYMFITASQCNRMTFLQDNHLSDPVISFPKTVYDELSQPYFDWSTVDPAMVPDAMLGFLYQKMRNTFTVEPENYRDPLQSILHHTNFSQEELAYAGNVSKLLYGPESLSKFNKHNLTGRNEAPSQRVLNLCQTHIANKKDASYWCDMLSAYVSTPVIKGAALALAVMTQSPLIQPLQLSKTARKVNEFIVDHLDALEPAQIRRGLYQLLNQRGMTPSRALEQEITSFCSNTVLNSLKNQSDTERLAFAQQFTQHAHQATEQYTIHLMSQHFEGSGIEKQANRAPKPRSARV